MRDYIIFLIFEWFPHKNKRKKEKSFEKLFVKKSKNLEDLVKPWFQIRFEIRIRIKMKLIISIAINLPCV